ncbi:MAG: hydrogen peroxide-inducible genes activator [Gammaproteobacteria bacterium]|nr:MAG: hydrogen peroxide-inducible genes activator [Gammaproteobacteria bacterium]
MASNPTLKQLKYLCAVAERRHFGKAAQSCFVTQSTLSAGVQELEQALGTPLLERGNKTILLTAAGEKVVARGIKILTEIQAMKEEAASSSEPLSNQIKLGAIPTIAPFLLPHPLAQLRKDYPKLQLLIREDQSENLVNLLHQGELDLIVLAFPYPTGSTHIHHLFYDSFLLAYPDHHKLGRQATIRPQDLKAQEFLLLEQGHCLRNHILDACKLVDSQVSVTFEATSLHTIVPMIANGVGITLLPAMAVDAGILSSVSGMSTAEFAEPYRGRIRREIGLAWRKNSPREKDYLILANYLVRQSHKLTGSEIRQ